MKSIIGRVFIIFAVIFSIILLYLFFDWFGGFVRKVGFNQTDRVFLPDAIWGFWIVFLSACCCFIAYGIWHITGWVYQWYMEKVWAKHVKKQWYEYRQRRHASIIERINREAVERNVRRQNEITRFLVEEDNREANLREADLNPERAYFQRIGLVE